MRPVNPTTLPTWLWIGNMMRPRNRSSINPRSVLIASPACSKSCGAVPEFKRYIESPSGSFGAQPISNSSIVCRRKSPLRQIFLRNRRSGERAFEKILRGFVQDRKAIHYIYTPPDSRASIRRQLFPQASEALRQTQRSHIASQNQKHSRRCRNQNNAMTAGRAKP